jgi:hypothetical protein
VGGGEIVGCADGLAVGVPVGIWEPSNVGVPVLGNPVGLADGMAVVSDRHCVVDSKSRQVGVKRSNCACVLNLDKYRHFWVASANP